MQMRNYKKLIKRGLNKTKRLTQKVG